MKIVTGMRKLIDLRAGVFWGLIMGMVVWGINIVTTTPPDYLGATTAALKQAVYTFFIGGLMMRLITRLAVRPGKPWLVIANASLWSSGLASGLVYLVHSLRGTPSPLLSSTPTAVMSIALFPVLAIRLRRELLGKMS